MQILNLPWVEIAILLSLAGALCVSRLRDPMRAAQAGLVFTGSVLFCTLLAALVFFLGYPAGAERWSLQPALFGARIFAIDELSAPLVPMVALLHFLTAVATPRTKVRRFSFSWSLAAEAVRIGTFSCKSPWVLIALLSLNAVPPLIELINRGKPVRVYVLHMALFVGLLALGWGLVELNGAGAPPAWATLPLFIAILVRCGTVPVHSWLTDWFEHASFGNALLYVTPLVGVYAAVRLVLPVAPDWMLHGIGIVSLVTAVYAAGMATVQRDVRRFFAFLFLSHSSLVLVGLELSNELSLTGALSLWFSVALSLGGFGLTLRALEARFGRLALTDFHGLYETSPTLAVCFLLTGLASVGFPGTLGFISTEVLVDGALGANLYVGIAVVVAGALNGVAVVRAYYLLFTGARHAATVSLRVGLREHVAVLTLAAIILAGGLFPQPGLSSRQRAAEEIRNSRRIHTHEAGEVALARAE
jgi:NADH-quinone oxidoreductase subunit M